VKTIITKHILLFFRRQDPIYYGKIRLMSEETSATGYQETALTLLIDSDD